MVTATSATATATVEKPPTEAELLVELPVLRFPPESPLTDDLLAQLSSLNDSWRFERTPEGALQIMPPASPDADDIGMDFGSQTKIWQRTIAGGQTYGSSPGFTMPDGSVLVPDAAWISDERLAALPPRGQRPAFPAVVPDLVIEVHSPSDRLSRQREKLERWIRYGARLGWLVAPTNSRVYVYRPGAEPEILERPDTISGEPEFPGLEIDCADIWW